MAKAKTRTKSKPATVWSPAVDAPTIAQLTQAVAQAQQQVAAIAALFPYLLSLTPAARQSSGGKMRAGEDKAVNAVLDFADAWPQYFTVLADRDFGSDASKFEVQLVRDRASRRAQLAALGAALESLVLKLGDTVLALGEVLRGPVFAAYKIARPLAAQNAAMAAVLAPAIAFYGGIAKKSAKTKAKKKATAKA
jgi:hypothetical protein